MKIKNAKGQVLSSTAIKAADEDMGFEDDFEAGFEDGDVEDTIDEVADNIEDLQDTVDEIQEDDVNIEVENNIEDHYIAECDKCHGIFISAVIESDQEIDHISGVCPLCQKESEQYLYWVIKKAGE